MRQQKTKNKINYWNLRRKTVQDTIPNDIETWKERIYLFNFLLNHPLDFSFCLVVWELQIERDEMRMRDKVSSIVEGKGAWKVN